MQGFSFLCVVFHETSSCLKPGHSSKVRETWETADHRLAHDGLQNLGQMKDFPLRSGWFFTSEGPKSPDVSEVLTRKLLLISSPNPWVTQNHSPPGVGIPDRPDSCCDLAPNRFRNMPTNRMVIYTLNTNTNISLWLDIWLIYEESHVNTNKDFLHPS